MTKGTITVTDGKVTNVHTPAPNNGWVTVKKNPDGSFYCSMGSEQDGGGNAEGTLLDALVGFHEDASKPYIKLFDLKDPTPQMIEAVGFKGYKILNAN